MGGRAYIEYTHGSVVYQIDLGVITSVSNSISKRVMITPIVSRPMRDAFPVESGNSQSYTLQFTRMNTGDTEYKDLEYYRTHGISKEESKLLSNEMWYRVFTMFVDRWQARTNGCRLYFDFDDGSTYYYPNLEVGGFIKSLNRVYSVDANEKITGTLTFTVGTMHMNQAPPNDGTSMDEMDILMSDSERVNWYLLHAGGSHSCITSARVVGGSESPFETVELKISRKKLQEFIPEFKIKGGIRLGRNRLYMDFMGRHTMDVVMVKTGETITIKAYCLAWIYTAAVLPTELKGDAFWLIQTILEDDTYGVSFTESDFQYHVNSGYDDTPITLPEGTNVWRALQICAMYIGCKIYFCDDKAFLIDYRLTEGDVVKSNLDMSRAKFDYTKEYVLFDKSDIDIGNRCTGTTTIDQEGVDPLANTVTIVGTPASIVCSDGDSVETYDSVEAGSISIPELQEDGPDATGDDAVHQGQIYGDNYVSYLREPQRSISFRFRETYHRSGDESAKWESYFGDVARAGAFYDRSSSDVITNYSDMIGKTDERMPQKLVLSQFERQYPEGLCEYTFGTIANIDLSTSTSQFSRALNFR